MRSYYQDHEREQIEQEFHLFRTDKSKINEISRLLWKITPTNDPQAPIYKLAHYGMARRLKILDRCVLNVFRINPVDLNRPPTVEELMDLVIYEKCFLFNLYGALENLFEIYAVTINFKISKSGQSLFTANNKSSSKLFETLPRNIQKEFHPGNEWIKYIKTARNFLAHKEPFYVSPQTISAEERKKWDELERQKARINRAYWEKLSLGPDNSAELEAEKNRKLSEIEKQLLEYMFSHPAILVDIGNRQDPFIKFHLQLLIDMKEIYEKIILILNYAAKRRKLKPL